VAEILALSERLIGPHQAKLKSSILECLMGYRPVADHAAIFVPQHASEPGLESFLIEVWKEEVECRLGIEIPDTSWNGFVRGWTNSRIDEVATTMVTDAFECWMEECPLADPAAISDSETVDIGGGL
jgi:hypothetical protein